MRPHLLLVVCFVPFATMAQYNVLPTGPALWVDGFWVGPGYPYMGWSYSMDASEPDTMVDGINYERLVGADPAYAIRDNGLGQVYFRTDGFDGEWLLYDFDVEVGDTLLFDFPFSFDSLRVASVDTVTMVGVERKRIGVTSYLGGTWPTQYWIQGIGSDGGLFNPCQGASVSGTSWLACMSESGIIQFGQTPGQPGDCLIYLPVPTVSADQAAVQVFPNPGKGMLTITCTIGAKVSAVRVMDAHGASVGTWRMDGDRLSMATEDWTSGVYTIEVMTNDSAPMRARWVRE